MKIQTILVVIGLGLSGCSLDQALTPQADRTEYYYLKLNAPTVDAKDNTHFAVMIGASRVSEMLEKKQIATDLGSGQLYYSSENVWGEDLEEGIRKSLRAELSTRLNSSQVGILRRTVELDEYHLVGYYVEELCGPLGGEVTLRVTWWIEQEGEKELFSSEFRKTTAGESYSDYVQAIQELIVDWSQEVADNLLGESG